MNTSIRMIVSILFAGLVLIPLTTFAANTNESKLLLAPDSGTNLAPNYPLPKFGFASFNIGGVGDRVTNVRWGGLASRLGLEPGDVILSLNGYRLRYHGAWNDALYQAMADGGWVRLGIRDVRTGHVTYRQTFVGGNVGPITPKFYNGGGIQSQQSRLLERRENDLSRTPQQIIRLSN